MSGLDSLTKDQLIAIVKQLQEASNPKSKPQLTPKKTNKPKLKTKAKAQPKPKQAKKKALVKKDKDEIQVLGKYKFKKQGKKKQLVKQSNDDVKPLSVIKNKNNIEIKNKTINVIRTYKFKTKVVKDYEVWSKDVRKKFVSALKKEGHKIYTRKISTTELMKLVLGKQKTKKITTHVKALLYNKDEDKTSYKSSVYHIDVPIDLTKEQLSDYVGLYITDDMEDNYHRVEQYDAKLYTSDNLSVQDLKMKGVNLHYKVLDGINDGYTQIKSQFGLCVPQYLYQELQGRVGFQRFFTYDKMIEQLNSICNRDIEKGKGVSASEIGRWLQKYHKNVSLYCFNPIMKLAYKVIATTHGNVSILTFIINNGHLYPITNEIVKRSIAKTQTLNSEDFNFVCEDYVYSVQFDGEDFNFLDQFNTDAFIKGKTDTEVLLVKDPEITVESLMNEVIRHTNHIDVPFKMNSQSNICSFQHPTTKQVVIEAYDFDERQMICRKFYKKYPIDSFVFRNQSHATLANTYFEYVYGRIPTSYYCQRAYQAFTDFSPRPLIQTIKEGHEGVCKSIDITKCHSACMLYNTATIPLYDFTCNIEPYNGQPIECGEYYIEDVKLPFSYKKQHYLDLPSKFYSYDLVRYLLDKRYIRKSNIKMFIRAKKQLDSEPFARMVEKMFKYFEPKVAKTVINHFFGNLNIKSNKSYKGFITDDVDTLLCMANEAHTNNHKYLFHELNGLFLYRQVSVDKKINTNCSAWRHFMGQEIKSLLQLLETIPKNHRIVGVNTDSVFYEDDDFEIDDDKSIGGYHMESKQPKCYKVLHNPDYCPSHYEYKQGSGTVNTGSAGCGKTQKLLDTYKKASKDANCIVLTPTNCAAININDRYGSIIAHTFDSYFSNVVSQSEGKMLDRLKGKVVFVDEFSMVSRKWWKVLYYAFLKHDTTVHIYGDVNQIEAVNETIIDVNWAFMKQMLPIVNHLQYIEASGRYTMKLYNILNGLLTNGKIDYDFNDHDLDIETNICYTNMKRKEVSKRLCKEGEVMNFFYAQTGLTEQYRIKENMGLTCTTNTHKKLNMYNSSVHTIVKISKDTITLKDEQGKENVLIKNEVRANFIPAYCSTTHKYQGKTIKTDYNIYEADKMSRNLLYTALSRAKHEDLIHIGELKDYYPPPKADTTIKEVHLMDGGKWKNSQLYKVSFPDGKFYIGYTTQDIDKRLEQHLKKSKSDIDYKTEVGKHFSKTSQTPTIERMAQCPCFERSEIEAYEHRMIQHYYRLSPDLVLNSKKIKGDAPPPKWKNAVKIEVERRIKIDQFNIKEDSADNCFYIKQKINGKVLRAKARYGIKSTKEQALAKVQKKCDEFAMSFSM